MDDPNINLFLFGACQSESDNDSMIKFLPQEIRRKIIKEYLVQKFDVEALIMKGYTSIVKEILDNQLEERDPLFIFSAIDSNSLRMVQLMLKEKCYYAEYKLKYFSYALRKNTDFEIIKYLIDTLDIAYDKMMLCPISDQNTPAYLTALMVSNRRIDLMNYFESNPENQMFYRSFKDRNVMTSLDDEEVFYWMIQREEISLYMTRERWTIFYASIRRIDAFSHTQTVFNYFREKFIQDFDFWGSYAFTEIIAFNRLDVFKWLWKTLHECGLDEHTLTNFRSMDWAAIGGRLDMLQWMHEQHIDKFLPCTSEAFFHACSKGYFDVVKWLHFNRNEVQYVRNDGALQMAIVRGHVNVIDFIVDNRSEVCLPEWFEKLFSNNTIQRQKKMDLLLKIFQKNPSLYENVNVVDKSVITSQIDMLKFFAKTMGMRKISKTAFNTAKEKKKLTTMTRWIEKRLDQFQIVE